MKYSADQVIWGIDLQGVMLEFISSSKATINYKHNREAEWTEKEAEINI